MGDPLIVLREFNMNKKTISEMNGHILFGKYSWPKDVKTNYLVWGSGKDGTPKEYYTLECLLFLLRHLHLRHPIYVDQARAENIRPVRRPDRKKLLAYLNGEISTSSSIDESAPVEIPATIKQESQEENQQAFKKAQCEEGEIEMTKGQPAARLDASKLSTGTTEHIKSLTDVMSAEMIAAMKRKCLAKKRSIGVTCDIISPERESQARAKRHNTGKEEDMVTQIFDAELVPNREHENNIETTSSSTSSQNLFPAEVESDSSVLQMPLPTRKRKRKGKGDEKSVFSKAIEMLDKLKPYTDANDALGRFIALELKNIKDENLREDCKFALQQIITEYRKKDLSKISESF